jgi:hypothetical protein
MVMVTSLSEGLNPLAFSFLDYRYYGLWIKNLLCIEPVEKQIF